MGYERLCRGTDATHDAGADFAAVLRPGDVVLLAGQLGAGKTTFVKGVAQALGVSERVTSPTFTMVRPYAAHNALGVATLHHADVYRVESLEEVLDLDLGELVEESAVVMVEWGDVAASVFGRDVLTLDFRVVEDGEARLVSAAGSIDHRRACALEVWAT